MKFSIIDKFKNDLDFGSLDGLVETLLIDVSTGCDSSFNNFDRYLR
jgi:hypothetical protein